MGECLAAPFSFATKCAKERGKPCPALREFGLTDQSILTGDRQRAAELIAQRSWGFLHLEAELLPAQKVERSETLRFARPPAGHGGRWPE